MGLWVRTGIFFLLLRGWVLCNFVHVIFIVMYYAFITFSSFSFGSLGIVYMFNLFSEYLILDILWSCLWPESRCIKISVWVGFLYIANSISFLRGLLRYLESCWSYMIPFQW